MLSKKVMDGNVAFKIDTKKTFNTIT